MLILCLFVFLDLDVRICGFVYVTLNLIKYFEVFCKIRNLMRSHEISWNQIKSHEVFWNRMESYEILWTRLSMKIILFLDAWFLGFRFSDFRIRIFGFVFRIFRSSYLGMLNYRICVFLICFPWFTDFRILGIVGFLFSDFGFSHLGMLMFGFVDLLISRNLINVGKSVEIWGVSWDLMKPHETKWNLMESYEIFWNHIKKINLTKY